MTTYIKEAMYWYFKEVGETLMGKENQRRMFNMDDMSFESILRKKGKSDVRIVRIVPLNHAS